MASIPVPRWDQVGAGKRSEKAQSNDGNSLIRQIQTQQRHWLRSTL